MAFLLICLFVDLTAKLQKTNKQHVNILIHRAVKTQLKIALFRLFAATDGHPKKFF